MQTIEIINGPLRGKIKEIDSRYIRAFVYYTQVTFEGVAAGKYFFERVKETIQFKQVFYEQC